jgi:Outer membrane protein beta-barrel domain
MTRTVLLAARGPARAIALVLALSSAFAALAAPSPADGTQSPAAPPAIRPLVGAMLTGTVSNDKVAVGNPDGSTAVGNLGGRYEVYAGAEFPIDPNGLALRLTAGLHASSSFANSRGGSEHVTSIPLEATLWYPVGDKLRLGGGVRYAMHTRFSGAGGKTNDGLGSTPAVVFQAGYRLMPHLLLDMRYVYQRYEQANGADLEASHWGLGLTAIY